MYRLEEKHDLVSIFSYKQTSAWISVKNFLTLARYNQNIRIGTKNKHDFFSFDGLKVLLISIKNYVKQIFDKKQKNIFLGGSTGVFIHNDRTIDAFFPYQIDRPADVSYMLNCGNLRELANHYDYIESNNIIIENYLVGPLKKIFSKIAVYFIGYDTKSKIKKFNGYLKQENLTLPHKQLYKVYADFVVGYELYRLFFKLLKIKKAYIVSAYTKPDIIAALKSLNIHCTEIQHGIVGQLHRGYNYNFAFDPRLPAPDHINVYNRFWKDEILKSLYFTDAQISITGKLKYDIANDNIKEAKEKYIVFTGQGGFVKDIISFFQQSDTLLTSKNIVMFYKPHPRETQEERILIKSSCNHLKSCFVYSGVSTAEELIKHSIAHVSVFSACHFDAIHYKNKTYILNVMGDNIMDYYSEVYPEMYVKIKTMKELLKHETLV